MSNYHLDEINFQSLGEKKFEIKSFYFIFFVLRMKSLLARRATAVIGRAVTKFNCFFWMGPADLLMDRNLSLSRQMF